MKPVIDAARHVGVVLDPVMLDRLEEYVVWLGEEAIEAGGLGPLERDRLEQRHLADSLLFAGQIPLGTSTVWDLGSGVGLPGIPLAITNPDIEFHLVDRSGRRVDLMQRAIRVLDLDNCVVRKSEIAAMKGPMEVIVSRATLPREKMAATARRLLGSGGVAIIGGSWRERPEHADWVTIEIPREVLDHSIWLLMMRRE